MNRLFKILSNNILTYIFLIVLSFTTCLNAQELTENDLLKLSFDSLDIIEDNLDDISPYYFKVLKAHNKKAKILSDSVQLLNSYYKLGFAQEYEDDAFLYADTMIYLSKLYKDDKNLFRAYYLKGALYYQNDIPENAIDFFIESYEIANDNENHDYILRNLAAIAALKSQHGEVAEALILDKYRLKYLEKHIHEINLSEAHTLISLESLSKSYTRALQLDSARYYVNKALELTQKTNDTIRFNEYRILQAQINYYDKNFLKARDTLLKYAETCSGTGRADILYYLGMIEGELGNKNKKKYYFENIDSILSELDFPIIQYSKEPYQFLLADAVNIKNTLLQKKYLQRLLYYDSLIAGSNDKIKKVTLANFDIPLEKQKDLLAKEQIENKNRILDFLYVLTTIVFIIMAFLTYRYIKIKILLKRLLNEDIKPIVASNNSIDPGNINIDREVIEKTLRKINEWENKNGFLDKEIDQNSLAKELDTNSTYLSRIINSYKKQSFSNYIKDLRVTYAINYIKRNPSVVKTKSMIQLAESFGFNSIDVFNRAFKSKVGFTPSVFFKQIKKGNL